MEFSSDYRMLVSGNLEPGSGYFDVLNPATEEVIGRAPDASREDLDAAVAAARAAFPAWASTSLEKRREHVTAVADALIDRIDPLMRLLTREQGKPLADSEAEIRRAAFWLKGLCQLDLPVTVNEDSPGRYSETRRVPLGVTGAIAPWNFPVVLAAFKIGPALLAGNTIVLKPSPFTPLTTLRLGEIVRDLLPPGVLNILSGGDQLGPWITAHPGIDKISFTGSTATGKKVMQSAASTLKRVTLELGGNDPAIVMPDADVESIAEPLFWSAFRNSGQVCIATKRLYIHKDVYRPLADALIRYAKTVPVGDGSLEGTRLGPINNRPQYERVAALIDEARSDGLKFLAGGELPNRPGYFIPVTIIDNPPENSPIVQSEQFGPVLPLLQFEDYDDVVARANATDYGLGATIWGRDERKAALVAQRILSGTVWFNQAASHLPTESFGGMKQSGLGVEGGVEGLLEYTNARTIVLRRTARDS